MASTQQLLRETFDRYADRGSGLWTLTSFNAFLADRGNASVIRSASELRQLLEAVGVSLQPGGGLDLRGYTALCLIDGRWCAGGGSSRAGSRRGSLAGGGGGGAGGGGVPPRKAPRPAAALAAPQQIHRPVTHASAAAHVAAEEAVTSSRAAGYDALLASPSSTGRSPSQPTRRGSVGAVSAVATGISSSGAVVQTARDDVPVRLPVPPQRKRATRLHAAMEEAAAGSVPPAASAAAVAGEQAKLQDNDENPVKDVTAPKHGLSAEGNADEGAAEEEGATGLDEEQAEGEGGDASHELEAQAEEQGEAEGSGAVNESAGAAASPADEEDEEVSAADASAPGASPTVTWAAQLEEVQEVPPLPEQNDEAVAAVPHATSTVQQLEAATASSSSRETSFLSALVATAVPEEGPDVPPLPAANTGNGSRTPPRRFSEPDGSCGDSVSAASESLGEFPSHAGEGSASSGSADPWAGKFGGGVGDGCLEYDHGNALVAAASPKPILRTTQSAVGGPALDAPVVQPPRIVLTMHHTLHAALAEADALATDASALETASALAEAAAAAAGPGPGLVIRRTLRIPELDGPPPHQYAVQQQSMHITHQAPPEPAGPSPRAALIAERAAARAEKAAAVATARQQAGQQTPALVVPAAVLAAEAAAATSVSTSEPGDGAAAVAGEGHASAASQPRRSGRPPTPLEAELAAVVALRIAAAQAVGSNADGDSAVAKDSAPEGQQLASGNEEEGRSGATAPPDPSADALLARVLLFVARDPSARHTFGRLRGALLDEGRRSAALAGRPVAAPSSAPSGARTVSHWGRVGATSQAASPAVPPPARAAAALISAYALAATLRRSGLLDWSPAVVSCWLARAGLSTGSSSGAQVSVSALLKLLQGMHDTGKQIPAYQTAASGGNTSAGESAAAVQAGDALAPASSASVAGSEVSGATRGADSVLVPSSYPHHVDTAAYLADRASSSAAAKTKWFKAALCDAGLAQEALGKGHLSAADVTAFMSSYNVLPRVWALCEAAEAAASWLADSAEGRRALLRAEAAGAAPEGRAAAREALLAARAASVAEDMLATPTAAIALFNRYLREIEVGKWPASVPQPAPLPAAVPGQPQRVLPDTPGATKHPSGFEAWLRGREAARMQTAAAVAAWREGKKHAAAEARLRQPAFSTDGEGGAQAAAVSHSRRGSKAGHDSNGDDGSTSGVAFEAWLAKKRAVAAASREAEEDRVASAAAARAARQDAAAASFKEWLQDVKKRGGWGVPAHLLAGEEEGKEPEARRDAKAAVSRMEDEGEEGETEKEGEESEQPGGDGARWNTGGCSSDSEESVSGGEEEAEDGDSSPRGRPLPAAWWADVVPDQQPL